MISFTTKVADAATGLYILKPQAFYAALAVLLEKAEKQSAGYLNIRLDLPHRPRSTGWKSQNHHLRGHVRAVLPARAAALPAIVRDLLGHPGDLSRVGDAL